MNGDLTIKHCHTVDMLGDHFSKPLQGALFRKFRAEIQGIPVDTSVAALGWEHEPRSEAPVISPHECVGLDDIPEGMSGARAMPNVEEAPPAKIPVRSDMSPGMSANKNLSESAPVPSDMPANNIVGMSANKHMPHDRNRHGNRFAAVSTVRQIMSPRKETLLTLLIKRRGEGEGFASLCTVLYLQKDADP
jgi:hypothetical protein